LRAPQRPTKCVVSYTFATRTSIVSLHGRRQRSQGAGLGLLGKEGGGAYTRAMKRALLLGTGVLLLLVAAATGIALAVRPVALGVPLDPGIPNERVLIARGLSGVPSPGQPTTPIAVDRVVTDGLLTYVQFHMTWPPPSSAAQPFPFSTLSDNTGPSVNTDRTMNLSPLNPALPLPLPSWFPWRPSTTRHGVVTFGPLSPTTRVAVMQLGNGETVRVPVNLVALRRVRAYTGPFVQRAGLQLRIAAARDTGLILGYGLTNDATSFGELRGVTLRDAQGRPLPFAVQNGACSSSGLPDVQLACRQVWTYPPQPHGERLTLSIQSVAATTTPVGPGPWHLFVTIP